MDALIASGIVVLSVAGWMGIPALLATLLAVLVVRVDGVRPTAPFGRPLRRGRTGYGPVWRRSEVDPSRPGIRSVNPGR